MANKRKSAEAAAPGAAKKARGGNAPKDTDAPKRPLSAFMLFSNARRGAVRAAHPELTFPEMGKKLGELWKELGEDEKAPFGEEAEKLKQAYDAEKAKYAPTAAANAAARRAAGAAAGGGDGGAAKLKGGKPPSALHVFVAERELAVRASMPDANDLSDLAARLAAAYGALSAADKEALEAKAGAAAGGGGGGGGGGVRKGRKLSDAARARYEKKHADLVSKRAKAQEKLGELSEQLGGVCAALGIAPPADCGAEGGGGGAGGEAEEGGEGEEAGDDEDDLDAFDLLAAPAASAAPAAPAAGDAAAKHKRGRPAAKPTPAAKPAAPPALAPAPSSSAQKAPSSSAKKAKAPAPKPAPKAAAASASAKKGKAAPAAADTSAGVILSGKRTPKPKTPQ